MTFTDRFKDRTAIVTGGAQGIGRAIAERLAREGAIVGILDRNSASVDQTASEMKADGLSCIAIACDVTDDTKLASAFERFAAAHGGLDIVVHSAAIVGPSGVNITEVDTSDFMKVCAVNLVGSFSVTKHALTQMKPKGHGRILLIASIAGKEGNAGMACYSATKAGVIGLVKAVGKEFAESGITVNAIAPATIQTAMVRVLPSHQVKFFVVQTFRC